MMRLPNLGCSCRDPEFSFAAGKAELLGLTEEICSLLSRAFQLDAASLIKEETGMFETESPIVP